MLYMFGIHMYVLIPMYLNVFSKKKNDMKNEDLNNYTLINFGLIISTFRGRRIQCLPP